MPDAPAAAPAKPAADFARGKLVLADGTVFEGQAFGAAADGVGEVCFNTAMTGMRRS
jgi:carbamoylphosphate synthase small subunit